MADTYYAWSEIRSGKDADVVRVLPGEEVSASSLLLEDEEFQELVNVGSVRKHEYPTAVAESGDVSPTEFYKKQLADLASGEIQPEDVVAPPEDVAPAATEEEEAPAATTKAAASDRK